MPNSKEIRKKARKELGEWMAKYIKAEIADIYKYYREEMGLRAIDAMAFARYAVQENLNSFARANFYGRSPW